MVFFLKKVCIKFSMLTLKMLVQEVALLAGGSLTRPMSVKCEETSKKQMGGSQASIIKIYSYTNLQFLNSKKIAPLSPRKRTGSSTWEAGWLRDVRCVVTGSAQL